MGNFRMQWLLPLLNCHFSLILLLHCYSSEISLPIKPNGTRSPTIRDISLPQLLKSVSVCVCMFVSCALPALPLAREDDNGRRCNDKWRPRQGRGLAAGQAAARTRGGKSKF